MSIIGIPIGRISDLFASTQLLNALQANQAAMLNVQEQMSTGYQFQTPEQDPQAAQQVVALQRQLSETTQYGANITADDSYLNATDSALGAVTTALSSVQGVALSAINSTTTSDERTAAAEQVQQTIQQLLDTANEQYGGRYLFSGSESTAAPFQQTASGNVLYNGNDSSLSSYADAGELFNTNVSGDAAFGAISAPVQGSTDLTPTLTFDTPLSDLNGGQGVTKGSIEISDGNNSSVVDLSQANTIGDVARMIEANPPAGDSLNVTLTATGLNIQLASGTGNLSVNEVGDGTTASDLGIFDPSGVGINALVGKNLTPGLLPTTPLADLLGTPATAAVHSAGSDNDVIFQSPANGSQDNNIQISYVDDGSVTAGHEKVAYTAASGNNPAQLVVTIQSGATTAAQVVAAVNAANAAGTSPLTASLDPIDDSSGLGFVQTSATATTSGGGGTVLDQSSGLQITNNNQTYTIDLSSAKTVQDLLNAINLSPAGMQASINATGNGINISSRLSGSSFTIGENGGTTATQLGIRTFSDATLLSQLNYGAGVTSAAATGSGSTDFTIQTADGTTIPVNVEGCQTIGDVINAIKTSAANAGSPLVAQLATTGNGIQLVDNSLGSGSLTITDDNQSTAANSLGLIPTGATTATTAATSSVALADSTGNSIGQLVFTAAGTGTSLNGVQIAFQNTGVAEGSETFTYPSAQPNTITIDIGNSTKVSDILSLIKNDPTASSLLTATFNSSGSGSTASLVNAPATPATIGSVLQGSDSNPGQTEGVFTALLNLQAALTNNDTDAAQQAITMLGQASSQVSSTRAVMDATMQNLTTLQTRQTNNETSIQSSISNVYDVDFASAASQFAQLQIAYQAALQTTAASMKMTLFSYM
jgi:flagellar hook-associated protein 3